MPTETETDLKTVLPAEVPASTLVERLLKLVSYVPVSHEPGSNRPEARALELCGEAARRAAACSAALALPPGPLALVTILPDLAMIWKIQRQLVSDIASVFGKHAMLDQRLMLYCLFRQGTAMALRDVVVRVGNRVLVREASLRAIQVVLRKLGIRVTQQLIKNGLVRWIPIAGSIGVGAYSFYDTMRVGKLAIETFAANIEIETSASVDQVNE